MIGLDHATLTKRLANCKWEEGSEPKGRLRGSSESEQLQPNRAIEKEEDYTYTVHISIPDIKSLLIYAENVSLLKINYWKTLRYGWYECSHTLLFTVN